MKNKRELGNYYEEIAKKYLINKKLTYIESNYYSRYGEIDLIFLEKESNTLVFIEVKYRKNINYGYAEEMVNKQKIEKIKLTSQIYILKVKWKENIRYDIIGITKNYNNYKIKWIKNAF